MSTSSRLLLTLEAETRGFHPDADGPWLELMAAGVNEEQYTAQLVRTYGFEAPLESALAYTPQRVVADRRDRSRTGLLVQDLLALGLNPATITRLPQCSSIEPFMTAAEALGWRYVIERCIQLHGAIKRNLVVRMPHLANAVLYLSACDGIAAARWHQLGALLDDEAKAGNTEPTIIDAACEAFRCLQRWIRGDAPQCARA